MADQQHVGELGTEANPPQPGLKFLEMTVYVMGGLLVIMLIILLGGIAWKASRKDDAIPEAPKSVDLGLPAGTQTGPLTLNGDRLAIPAGNEIIIVDIRKGQILSRVKLTTQ